MAKNLLIVESPAKTKTLARFLGPDFDILATVGHIIDLPKSKIGVDVDNDFTPVYTVIEGKEKIIAKLKKAASKAKTIYLAPDPDREGEAIAWHVANSIKGGTKANIVRVAFNEITKSAVLEAIANPHEINMNRVNAQQARRMLDRIVGYTVSPFLWKTIAYNLSAGRVQSVALRLVCEREEAVLAFKPQEYWNIMADLKKGKSKAFNARLYQIDSKSVVKAGDTGPRKITITNEKDAKKIINDLKKSDFVVDQIKSSSRTRKTYAPFITSTLQQQAAQALGLTPNRTMSLAQKLYEGVEIGKEGQVGLITYMRTDSTRISNEAMKAVRGFIKKEYGSDFLPDKPNQYGKKKTTQDAHEAIRPTSMKFFPEKMKKHLTPQQLKLYTLIWNRFVASQMKPAVYDVQTVDIAAGKYTFRVTAQSLKFEGFLKVYQVAKDIDEKNGNGEVGLEALPPLKEGDKLKASDITPTQSFTKPPPRFSEAMLIKELEADGIGRPSTYASIISTIRSRKYVDLEERRLVPTELGKIVNKVLVENLPTLFDVQFTSNMEKELDLIEEGVDEMVKVMSDFYGPFKKSMDSLAGRQKEIKEALTEKTDIKCDKCGGQMVIKWGRNGRFMSCANYPKCRNAGPLPGEEEQMKTDKICEKCNSPMVVKTGRYGRFLACSAYPECKNTQPITLGIKCPKDGCEGEVVEKKTKSRRSFFGCSKYPDCDFASWDMPVDKKCPACGNYYMVAKTSKAKGEFFRCPQCKHDHVPVAEGEESKSVA